ncbi:class II aldolase/adducin family protein, partial [Campylobacter coli]|nr:class II aldolase/adducin family protein [Campylobacter coli]ECS0795726.1 class II aldolase/adducin family protein [Campylobacter coli]
MHNNEKLNGCIKDYQDLRKIFGNILDA